MYWENSTEKVHTNSTILEALWDNGTTMSVVSASKMEKIENKYLNGNGREYLIKNKRL